jgi:hypothetical protein
MSKAGIKSKPTRRRATKREVCERIAEVCKLVLLGAEASDLRECASEKGWNISTAQLRRYHQHALKKFARQIDKNIDRNFARHFLQRRALYARAMESGDWRTALAIAKDEAELLGLYPDKLDELTRRLDEIEAANAKRDEHTR